MDSQQRDEWWAAHRLFQRVMDLDDAARDELLAASDANAAVRAKLQSMLSASQRRNPLLDSAGIEMLWFAMVGDDGTDAAVDALCGRRVGDWELIELIGHGGMTAVYRGTRVGRDYAQQSAVKLLGVALRGPLEQARFRREQRILAQLQHPHIASLIDAGVADDGTPYLAMSLIDGERIDCYCDNHNLSLNARVGLVLQVCAAVAYAHRHLVIHRDIKPGNILVDGSGHATLLDFGIARLLDVDASNDATVTRAFTPDYAAPEQRNATHALGTAVDVYGLGAVLHRLLAGASPQHDAHGEPVSASSVARQRDDTHAAAALRGDLDAVLGHALASDPNQRYPSVDALASDLGAWLRHRPLQARRTTVWTRAGKFVRRNRVACALALAATLAAAAGLTTFVLSQRALEQRATELQAVTQFQSDMLQKVVPQEVGAQLRRAVSGAVEKAATIDEITDAAIARIDYTGLAANMIDAAVLKRSLAAVRKHFAAQPRVQAPLLQTLANSYRDLGLRDAAQPIQAQATALFREVLGEGDPQALASMRDELQLLRNRSEGHPVADGEVRHRDVLRLHVRYLGEGNIATALASDGLGQWLMAHGKAEEAEPLLRAAAASIERSRDADAPGAIAVRANLAYAIDAQEHYAEAVPYYRRSIADMTRVFGPDHHDTLLLEGNLAYVLNQLGQTKPAEVLLRKVYDANRLNLGSAHPLTLNSLNSLAVLMGRNGQFVSAEPFQTEAYEQARRSLGSDHTFTLNAQMNLANVQRRLGNFSHARELLVDVIPRWKKHDDQPAIVQCQRWLGQALAAMGEPKLAEQALMQSWQLSVALKRQGAQRKSAQALVALYSGPGGSATELARWQQRVSELTGDEVSAVAE